MSQYGKVLAFPTSRAYGFLVDDLGIEFHEPYM